MRRFLFDVQEIWKYRSLLHMLVVRDLKTRYRSSVLGVAWSFLQPLGMMVVMTFAFSVINRAPPTIEHYSVFILSGLLAWNFFSAAVTGATGSVVANASLVKKVYFPRSILPVSVVISSLINFLLALPVWMVVTILSGHPIHITLLLLPFVIAIQVIFSVGVSFMLSTLNVFYRDTQFILELAMLALFFLTPIWYDIDSVPQREVSLWVRRLNPMASLVNIYQDLMYWGRPTDLDFVLRTVATAIAVLVAGYLIFRHFSPRFGEEV
ncbi:MAG: ABC transporter permease [Anaerolineae bacterium]|jgi:lipopolysaccharide transport system permease protein|nr:ABC transporter permease [Anaerolineae bacterium]